MATLVSFVYHVIQSQELLLKKKRTCIFFKVQMLNAWSLNSLEILEPLTDCVNHDKN